MSKTTKIKIEITLPPFRETIEVDASDWEQANDDERRQYIETNYDIDKLKNSLKISYIDISFLTKSGFFHDFPPENDQK